MLSPKTIAIIKSTAPVLAEHGETLTRHFYQRMFKHNPEVQAFFNPAHQVSGTQQRALAGAICAYAVNIDNLGALAGAVEVIAQKHASLQIRPEHYPIVGENLLASIREVLGGAATDDIVNAWGEAYGVLANVLIGREAEIYESQATAPNGWDGFKPFKVVRREKESDIITSFYLAPADGAAVPSFKPGQYITLRVPSPCGHTTMRNYSLSDKPDGKCLRISVKRESGADAATPAGYVSNMLHDRIMADAVLDVAPPCGEFFLDTAADTSRPLVLLAGGVGITPIYSIAAAALEKTPVRAVTLLYACRDENVQAFRASFDAMAKQYPNFRVQYFFDAAAQSGISRAACDRTGIITATDIDGAAAQDADYYFCGPRAFMAHIHKHLIASGVAADRIHFEFFGPRQELAA